MRMVAVENPLVWGAEESWLDVAAAGTRTLMTTNFG